MKTVKKMNKNRLVKLTAEEEKTYFDSTWYKSGIAIKRIKLILSGIIKTPAFHKNNPTTVYTKGIH